MPKGEIKKLRTDKGYGFIATQTGSSDIFFHARSMPKGAFEQLQVGQQVDYTEGTAPDGRVRAEHVRVL